MAVWLELLVDFENTLLHFLCNKIRYNFEILHSMLTKCKLVFLTITRCNAFVSTFLKSETTNESVNFRKYNSFKSKNKES